ncbi:MAG TPA: Asp-tRNA(Asn)/Glu-tRNA(Gln) amidotransferase subunit GatA [Candidatus Sumerlaeota bacterium]|nr:Asp-tRNA(Asn)/Glu-tRNA(Gln) amidotransferase subunit GatA [Candidatus Sumerlaeota bacterium]HNM45383.1 Asp-tRNA(Asn)/Glu-tRNA(Gln) amidotransferase subunit GatA [Candidatus Sumerlaeota bacterium]
MHPKTAHELSEQLQRGETTSVKLTQQYLEKIERTEPKLHSFITVMGHEALAAAEASDRRRVYELPLSPFDGVPVAVKDNMITKGTKTTCASRILENFVPPYTGTVVQKLQDAGLILIGKANLDEFAMGSSTENSAFGRSHNPWNTDLVPGGSSGGSATCVAGGQVPWSLGSDTGGSIRQPAALCGIVGLKPTYGRVSRYGLVAFASSLDQIGPMTTDVEDAAHLLRIISGYDTKDSTSANVPVPDYGAELKAGSLRGKKVARPKEFFSGEGMDADVAKVVDAAVEKLASLGAEIVDVSMPHLKYSISCYYLVATAECSSNLARYDGAQYGYRAEGTKNIVEMFSRSRAEGFGAEVKRRIMMGTHALSAGYYDAYYSKALKIRTLLKRDYDEALKKADLIVAPTSPIPAFRAGAKADPMSMYLCDIFTLSLNLAGYCGISIPAGFTAGEGLPVGVQLFAGAFEEVKLLQASYALEQALGVVGSRLPAVVG